MEVVVRTRKRVKSVYFGWWIVAGGSTIQALHGSMLLHGFTAYFIFLQDEFGWSRAVVAAGFAFTRFESAILGPFQGWLVDRFGARPIVFIGLFIFGGGFLLFSRVNSLPMYFIAFAVMAVGASLGGFISVTATIANWFSRRRAMAMGIALTGTSLGGLMVPVLAWSLTAYGWRTTAVISGLLIWFIGMPVALLLRRTPEEYGYLPDGRKESPPLEQVPGSTVAETSAEATIEYNFTAREALRTPAFWLISCGHASALLVVSAVAIHQIPHMVQAVGLSIQAAGGIVAYLMVVAVTGQLLGGYVADKMSKRILLVACLLGHMAGLLVLAYATNLAALFLYATLHGLSWGVRGPTQQSLRADYFGRASFATILGFSSLVMMIAMMVAPIFAGWLADLQGDYRMAFTILAVLTGFGSVFFMFARKPIPRSVTGSEQVASR